MITHQDLIVAAMIAGLVIVWSFVGWLIYRDFRPRRRPAMATPRPVVAALARLDPNQTAVRRVDDQPSAFDKLVGIHGYQRPAFEVGGVLVPPRPAAYVGQHRTTVNAVNSAANNMPAEVTPAIHEGATVGWSPMQDQADASDADLTPTGLLETEAPAALDDGTVLGSRGLPAWDALQTDTHHALDAAWEQMLAEFRANMDAIIAKLDPENGGRVMTGDKPILIPYEDHIPEGQRDEDGDVSSPECFVCGHEWPCGKTIAYNDGLNDGAINERARIAASLYRYAELRHVGVLSHAAALISAGEL